MITKEAYDFAFEMESLRKYPRVSHFEERMGAALDRDRLENAARVLACPVKVNAPNWQHGRIVYAAARRYLRSLPKHESVLMVDIGTAKGFSALCMQWALDDAQHPGQVVSVDVLPLHEPVRRNTVAEVDGFKTLAQILEPWPEAKKIDFRQEAGVDFLRNNQHRVNFAFVDGKHSFEAVSREGIELSRVQRRHDVLIFDDVQMPGVAEAVMTLAGYQFDFFPLSDTRKYAIGIKVLS